MADAVGWRDLAERDGEAMGLCPLLSLLGGVWPAVQVSFLLVLLDCHLSLGQQGGMLIWTPRLFPIIDEVKVSGYTVSWTPRGVVEVWGKSP